jgi:hypothetical protein
MEIYIMLSNHKYIECKYKIQPFDKSIILIHLCNSYKKLFFFNDRRKGVDKTLLK